MPLVSVILPTRDRSQLLPRAVQSVLCQTEQDFELVLVDNNTTGSVAMQHANAEWLSDPRLKIIPAGKVGTAAAARNAGLVHAKGNFVTYLDDDDAYQPAKLSRQLRRIQQDITKLVLCGGRYHLDGRLRDVQCEAEFWDGDARLLRARWGTPFLLHQAVPDVRFDEDLAVGEDLEFGLRLMAYLGLENISVVPAPLVDVYPQPGARVNTGMASRRQATARVLYQHRARFSRTARRRFLLRALLAEAKLSRQPMLCVGLSWRLLRESNGADWRACANACAVSLGLQPNRWVS